jgi:hypothetical protein
VIDWGVGRAFRVANHSFDVGASGFGAWQLTAQRGGLPEQMSNATDPSGSDQKVSLPIFGRLTLRLRIQIELAARDIVRGNNVWIIFNYRF